MSRPTKGQKEVASPRAHALHTVGISMNLGHAVERDEDVRNGVGVKEDKHK